MVDLGQDQIENVDVSLKYFQGKYQARSSRQTLYVQPGGKGEIAHCFERRMCFSHNMFLFATFCKFQWEFVERFCSPITSLHGYNMLQRLGLADFVCHRIPSSILQDTMKDLKLQKEQSNEYAQSSILRLHLFAISHWICLEIGYKKIEKYIYIYIHNLPLVESDFTSLSCSGGCYVHILVLCLFRWAIAPPQPPVALGTFLGLASAQKLIRELQAENQRLQRGAGGVFYEKWCLLGSCSLMIGFENLRFSSCF